MKRLNTELAMEWLLEHSEDPDIDQPISEDQMRQLAQAEANFAPDAGVLLVIVRFPFMNKIQHSFL